MFVVTVDGFTEGTEPVDEFGGRCMYAGNSCLLRFRIPSVRWFFQVGFRHIVDIFGIDPRSVYEVRIDGLSGYFTVQLFVSFEGEFPDWEAFERLQEKPDEVSLEAGTSCLSATVRELVERGVFADKIRESCAQVQEEDYKGLNLTDFEPANDMFIAGSNFRFEWEAFGISSSEILDLAFVVVEGLRCRFHEFAIRSFAYRALPETEESYTCSIEYVAPAGAQMHTFCSSPRRGKACSAEEIWEKTPSEEPDGHAEPGPSAAGVTGQ